MLMHSIAHGGCTDEHHKPDSLERLTQDCKIPCRTKDSNPHQLAPSFSVGRSTNRAIPAPHIVAHTHTTDTPHLSTPNPALLSHTHTLTRAISWTTACVWQRNNKFNSCKWEVVCVSTRINFTPCIVIGARRPPEVPQAENRREMSKLQNRKSGFPWKCARTVCRQNSQVYFMSIFLSAKAKFTYNRDPRWLGGSL